MTENKKLCKKYLQMAWVGRGRNKTVDRVHLEVSASKGIHLIERAVTQSENNGNQFVLLGSGHTMVVSNEWPTKSSPKRTRPTSIDDYLLRPLSRLMYAAADFVLVLQCLNRAV